VTDKKTKEQMELITASFAYQLRCASQAAAAKTQTGCSPRSWIASCVPDDDCWTRMIEEHVVCDQRLCTPEEEGAVLIIERINK
jgi:hypothetical protein